MGLGIFFCSLSRRCRARRRYAPALRAGSSPSIGPTAGGAAAATVAIALGAVHRLGLERTSRRMLFPRSLDHQSTTPSRSYALPGRMETVGAYRRRCLYCTNCFGRTNEPTQPFFDRGTDTSAWSSCRECRPEASCTTLQFLRPFAKLSANAGDIRAPKRTIQNWCGTSAPKTTANRPFRAAEERNTTDYNNIGFFSVSRTALTIMTIIVTSVKALR